MNKELYTILTNTDDDDVVEVEVTASEYLQRAIHDGWTIDSEVARAIQELLEAVMQSGIKFGGQLERMEALEKNNEQTN